MASMTIIWKDGEEYLYDNGAPGGSYEQTYKCENGFVIITNAHGEKRIIPSDQIVEIKVHSERRHM